MSYSVDSGLRGCVRSPKHFEEITLLLPVVAEIFEIRSLGAFYCFKDLKVAYSVVQYWGVVVFCILCVSLLRPWQSEFVTRLLKGGSLPSLLYLGSVCRSPGRRLHQCRTGLSQSHQALEVFGFCQFGSCHSSLLTSSRGAWLRGRLRRFTLFAIVRSISVKQYFWQNTFH